VTRRGRRVGAALFLAACSDYSGVDSSADAGPTLLANSDFAQGCAGWTVFGTNGMTTSNVTIEQDPTGHTASPSCRVCRTTPFEGDLGIVQSIARPVKAGDKFYGEAWLRTAPGKATPSQISMLLAVRATPDDFATQATSAESKPTLADDWKQANVLFTAPDGGGAVALVVTAHTAKDQTCFLIDDALLRVEP
jgi:hypothetical protein